MDTGRVTGRQCRVGQPLTALEHPLLHSTVTLDVFELNSTARALYAHSRL